MQMEIYSLHAIDQYVGLPILITAGSLTIIGDLVEVTSQEHRTILTVANDETNFPLHVDVSLTSTDLLSGEVTLSVSQPRPAIDQQALIFVKDAKNSRAPLNTLYSFNVKLDRWISWGQHSSNVPLREEDILDFDIVDTKNFNKGGFAHVYPK